MARRRRTAARARTGCAGVRSTAVFQGRLGKAGCGDGGNALRTAGLLHAVSGAAQSASRARRASTSTEWAREMGMLEGSGIWEERDLDAHDYALLCAYTHPDCDGPGPVPGHRLVRVGLLLRRPLPGDLQTHPGPGGRQGVSRPAPGVHADGPRRPRCPSRPIRSRRVSPTCGRAPCPRMSADWRARFAESTENLLNESLWELSNINDGRIANPVEYIEMRRKVGGAPWSAGLVEYAAGAEVPGVRRRRRGRCGCCGTPSPTPCTCATTSSPTSARSRTRARTATACWSWRPSWAARPRRRPTPSTTCSPRGSSSSRTPRSPNCPRSSPRRASTRSRARTSLAYVKGLQDWQSGGHEWHMRSSRYMNEGARGPTRGPRALARAPAHRSRHLRRGRRQRPADAGRAESARARSFTHVPYQQVGPSQLPDFYMPFTATDQPASRRRPAARRRVGAPDGHARAAAGRARLAHLGRATGSPPIDLPLCAAGIRPGRHARRARPERRLAGLGHVRRRLLPGRSSGAAATWRARRLPPTGCRPSCRSTAARRRRPANALERGLADLWARTAGPMTPERAPRSARGRRGHDARAGCGSSPTRRRTASPTPSTTSRCAG